jgi:drug/metabolite transporter (DMT)-like permease
MTSTTCLVILVAALLHASWNAVVKSGDDKMLGLALIHIVAGTICVFLLPFANWPARAAWPYLGLSVMLHWGYYWSLAQGYRVGELSYVYPIARGTAPLIVAGGAVVFAGELISGTTLLGILVVSGGIITLGLEQGLPDRHQWKPLSFGLLTGIWISAYTLTDALGVRHSGNALGYIASLFMLEAVTFGFLIAFIRRQQLGGYLKCNWRSLLGGGIAAAGAYGLVIYVMNSNTIAIVAALRETSVVMAALIGARLLKERFGPTRLAAAVMVTMGIILMNAGT